VERMRILWPVVDLYKGENRSIGIMILASLLKEHGCYSEIVDANFGRIEKKLVQSEPPTLIAYSTSTVHSGICLDLNRRLKKKHTFFALFGGPHPTFFPEMIQEQGVDAICVGEGEYAMLELVDKLSAGEPIEKIENLWVNRGGRIYKNPVRPLIQDLDRLPLPDHELFRRVIPNKIWYACVLTGRGCPYHCTYCFNHSYRKLYRGKGKYIRRRSVSGVMEELHELKKHKGYRFIKFADDIFTLQHDWLEEFCPRYEEEIALPFSCLTRANHVNPRILRMLKEAGCYKITLGLEAGNDALRNDILRRNMSKDELIQAARWIKEQGIRLQTGNMIGIPGGSVEADLETLRLNIQCRTDYSGVTLLQPYHRTEMYDYAKTLGMIDPDPHVDGTSFRRISMLKFKSQKQKSMTENLQKLFPLVVSFPWLYPGIKYLIRLPRNPLFDSVFSRWVNFCQYFRMVPCRIGMAAIWERSIIHSVISKLKPNEPKPLDKK
jgi:anaerobic magnesium-protoporphyrin IX monomethyl ester cyclase